MERETNNRKRGREEQEAMEMGKGSTRKKPSSEATEISPNSEDGGGFLKPLSVFEFPWQHDFIPSSHKDEEKEEEDWKDSGSLLFPTPPSIFWDHAVLNGFGTAPTMAGLAVQESWPIIGDVDVDGADCIWSSILSQPLFVESLNPLK